MQKRRPVSGSFKAVSPGRRVNEDSSACQLRMLGERCRRLAIRSSDRPVSKALRDMAIDFDAIASALAGPKFSA